MFCTLRNLVDARVIAKDGRIGRVCDFLFDDQSWNVGYIVVSVKAWLVRRTVVLPTSAVTDQDWEKKLIWVRLSKEQVRRSPTANSLNPVNRQQELALRKYYRWPAYWEGNWGEFNLPPLPVGREYPVHSQEDRHLRSAEHLITYEVWDQKALIGRLEDFVVDPGSWHISYLDVRAGTWLQSRYVLLPIRCVRSISWGNHRVSARHASARTLGA
jgi:uncharacterized protein YrrD